MFKIGQPGNIVSLLNEGVKPIFLLGAGASKQSGVKLVVEIVEEAAKWAYCKENGISIDDPRLTMSDWKKWLTNFPWYTEDYSILYPVIVEQLLNPRQARKDFFLKIISPDVPASQGYEKLAELMALNLVDTILTANFDNCLSNARVQIRKPPVIQTIKTPSDLSQFSYTPRYPQLVYLHGSVEHYTDQNLNEEIQKLNTGLVDILKPLLKDRPLIVVGYRGSEPSIMNNLFLDNLDYTNNFHQGIYWCVLKRELAWIESDPQATPDLFKKLAEATKNNFQLIPIDGFDEMMTREIMGKLKANQIDLKNTTVQWSKSPIPAPTFDTSLIAEKTIGPLEIALIRERVRNYSERLHIKIYEDQDWLYQQMLRLRIAEFTGQNEYELTLSGILLFSSKTQNYIPDAFTILKFVGDVEWLKDVTSSSSEKNQSDEDYTYGSIERRIYGNIWNQLNEITDALTLVNKPFRLKGQVSENVYPYPTLALKEIIVNCLVHRNYQVDAPIIIEVHPDRIIFISPGGLVEEVKRQLSADTMEEEIRRGRRGIKGYRNPVLADLFYGSGAMDKEGSGLSDVLKQVNINSSAVSFGPTPDDANFQVLIYRRMEDVDKETKTANPLVINATTKFACNLFEVLKYPVKIYHADFLTTKAELYRQLEKAWCPPFLFSRERIWSFYDFSESQNPLHKFVDLGTIESISTNEFIDISGNTNEFVRMMNDCLADHFFSIGLRVDTKKKRAYFTKTNDGNAKEISYQARLKKATRTVARPKVNLQTGRTYYWEHKSIWYAFENIGGTWYLLLNPSYVFTTDGFKAFLKSERVNILSTKKASRDYNLAVHNDLSFWANYISLGNQNAFLLRPNSRGINEGTMLGPIPPDIVLSGTLPTITINDVSIGEEFTEPIDLDDIEEIENELIELAKQEQERKD